MIRPAIFLAALALLLGALFSLEARISDIDPFRRATSEQLVSITGVSPSNMADLKQRHVAATGRPDIGLFGNSRILAVGQDELGTNQCQAFNFAVGGESLRSSIAFLERLARDGAHPEIAVISADHFELQVYSNPYLLGHFFGLSELFNLATLPDMTIRTFARMTWRLAWTQSQMFQRAFEAELVRGAILRLFAPEAAFPLVQQGQTGYRPDGSRRTRARTPTGDPELEPRNRPQIPAPVLIHDLERLAGVKQRFGIDVYVYESPLAPNSMEEFAASPSEHAVSTRNVFLDTCERLGLSCVAAPNLQTSDGEHWYDSNHAPPGALGRWIGDLIAESAQRCGQ